MTRQVCGANTRGRERPRLTRGTPSHRLHTQRRVATSPARDRRVPSCGRGRHEPGARAGTAPSGGWISQPGSGTQRHRAEHVSRPLSASQLGSARPEPERGSRCASWSALPTRLRRPRSSTTRASRGFGRWGTSHPTGWSTTCPLSRTGTSRSARSGKSRGQLNAFAERLIPVLADMGVAEIFDNIIRR
jgi:hypothetical protein